MRSSAPHGGVLLARPRSPRLPWDPPRPLGAPFVPSSVSGAPWDPLEAKREVCELNPDCDELADQIGLQEAYRRYYGLV